MDPSTKHTKRRSLHLKKRDMEYLLKKYETKQPGEIWTREHETQHKRKQFTASKHNCADIIMQNLPIKGDTRLEVHYLIDKYRNFNQLNTHMSRETIIGCFCYYVMRTHNPSVRVEDYKILKKLNVTYEGLTVVFGNMLKLDNNSNFLKPKVSIIK